MTVFEKFEPTARQAFLDARNEARRAGQDRVGSEHVLLGLLAEPGAAADALADAGLDLESLRAWVPRGSHEAPAGLDAEGLATLGIDLDAVRRATDAAFGRGALDRVAVPGQGRLPIGDDAKAGLAHAVRQAQQLGQRQISSGHMLLGLIDQRRNAALMLLTQAGIDIPALRADVLRRITAAR
jgi:ATP-dependent Clp protease ATP-binding subunit ClpA